MRYRSGMILLMGLFIANSYASSVVLYPMTGVDPEPGSANNQTMVLHNVPRVQPNPWFDFFSNLQSCVVGTYSLPNASSGTRSAYGSITVVKILESTNDVCHFTIDSKMVNQVGFPTVSDTTSGELDCKFKSEAIDLYIKHYTNQINGTASDPDDETEYAKHMQDDCKKMP